MKDKKRVVVISAVLVCLFCVGIFIRGNIIPNTGLTDIEKSSEEMKQISEETEKKEDTESNNTDADTKNVAIENVETENVETENVETENTETETEIVTLHLGKDFEKKINTMGVLTEKNDDGDTVNSEQYVKGDNTSPDNMHETEVSESRNSNTTENNKTSQNTNDIELPIIRID